ncbi:MAG TPA: sterol desaturase [Cytophagales bacterium]|nr:sterol desaturase [Cytophagales bacterium]HAA21241.1 sterol desaturase [Cytophagales bacterium]HAP62430.1 sterol desaturase [Cytophagales bacterium]
MEYWNAFVGTLQGHVNYIWKSILFQVDPWYANYFWGLILISLVVWGLELAFPWRKNQKAIRKDFWLDAFYMFFNFFLFAVAIGGVYEVMGLALGKVGVTMSSIALLDASALHPALQLLIFFIVSDFVQWLTHVSLHKVPFFWRFHKVHHSVKEMGFAAHLRYHWMENILYKPLKTFAVMILFGFEPAQAFIVHFMAITIGHLNHANMKLTWGPLKYILNNPVMHLYHHAKQLPHGQTVGVNFGISLSVWDYLFGTNYIPEDSGTIELGFEDIDEFPTDFVKQSLYGFGMTPTERKKEMA